MFQKNHLAVLPLIAGAGAFAPCGTAYAAPGGEIIGCVDVFDHYVRIVAQNDNCARFERKVTWNQQGVAGAQGPVGLTGAQGPVGPAGAQGPTGPAGADGPTGAQGPTGPAGADGPTGAQGPTGPAGAQGPEGPTGPSGTSGYEAITGPDITLVAGANVASVAIPTGKVPTGGGLVISGNSGASAGSFGPDGAGNWQDTINAPQSGGSAHAVVFVVDAP